MAADYRRSSAAPLTLDLHFPSLTGDLVAVTIRVVIEDVGKSDIAPPRLGGAAFKAVDVARRNGRLQLALDLPDLTGAAVPVIRVHVDRSGSGRVQIGDYINPGIIEVPTDGTAIARVELIEVW